MPADASAARPVPRRERSCDSPTPFAWCRELSSIIGVKPGDPDTGSVPSDPAQLLPLAVSRPQDALLAARSVLAGQPSAYDASLAHHAIGIVLRDRGDLPEAIAELRKGLRLARASGKPEREVDVQATLGTGARVDGPQPARAGPAGPGGGGLARRPDRPRAHAARLRPQGPGPLPRRTSGPEPRPALLPPDRRHGMGGPVADASGPRSSSGSASPAARPRISPAPRSCSPPAGRNSSTPRPGTTAGWWR